MSPADVRAALVDAGGDKEEWLEEGRPFLTARVLRDVGKGEELCIDYLGGEGSGERKGRWRRDQLYERYGFHTVCSCPGCAA